MYRKFDATVLPQRFLHFWTLDTDFLQSWTLFSGLDTFCSQTALAACIHAHLIREHRTLLSDACQDTCASLCINSLLVQTATALYRVPMEQFPTSTCTASCTGYGTCTVNVVLGRGKTVRNDGVCSSAVLIMIPASQSARSDSTSAIGHNYSRSRYEYY